MRTFAGYAAIIWGALLLRLRLVTPPIGSVEFFRYRRDWNARIAKAMAFDFDVEGPMPPPGTLIVANHQGFGDINALCALLPPETKANFLSKIEIGRLPIFGWHMLRYGDVLFDRQNPNARRQAMEECLRRLQEGFSLGLFPEGTRSRDGKPKAEVRTALVAAAIHRNLCIQPVAIVGTANAVEKRWQKPWRHRIILRFGEARRDWPNAERVWEEVKRMFAEAS